MNKTIKRKLYLTFGFLPYALIILYLLYSMIFGMEYCSGLFQTSSCSTIYGFEAAYGIILGLYLLFLIFWYIFIPVILLTIFLIYKGFKIK